MNLNALVHYSLTAVYFIALAMLAIQLIRLIGIKLIMLFDYIQTRRQDSKQSGRTTNDHA